MRPVKEYSPFHREFNFIPDPLGVFRDSREAFPREGRDLEYTFFRGLTKTFAKRESYRDILPKYQGNTAMQLITNEIQRRKAIASHGGKFKKVRIIDVGYGTGHALLEASKIWGDDVELIGYGDSFHTHVKKAEIGVRWKRRITVGPTNEELKKRNIRLIEGDVLDINKNLKKELGEAYHADFVIMSRVMQYIDYPMFEFLKKLYKVLSPKHAQNPGGILLATNCYAMNIEDTNEDVYAYLNRHGYAIEVQNNGIALQKTLDQLPETMRTTYAEGRYDTIHVAALTANPKETLQ